MTNTFAPRAQRQRRKAPDRGSIGRPDIHGHEVSPVETNAGDCACVGLAPGDRTDAQCKLTTRANDTLRREPCSRSGLRRQPSKACVGRMEKGNRLVVLRNLHKGGRQSPTIQERARPSGLRAQLTRSNLGPNRAQRITSRGLFMCGICLVHSIGVTSR